MHVITIEYVYVCVFVCMYVCELSMPIQSTRINEESERGVRPPVGFESVNERQKKVSIEKVEIIC